MKDASNALEEISKGQRFEFGENWAGFLNTLTEERIIAAECSLKKILGLDDFSNKKFLDIGSGCGLFSLAARRLGATVYSFDYDLQSVAVTKALKKRFCNEDPFWIVDQGSVLDQRYLESLGLFDIVYSWGVLHHTGEMLKAFNTIITPVAKGGLLCIAIYNDQGIKSKLWTRVKKLFCKNRFGKYSMLSAFIPYYFLRSILVGLVKFRDPFGQFKHYKNERGMSIYYDWIDWIGGYPFEVAKPEMVVDFYIQKNFTLSKIKTTNRLGCN